MNMLDYPTNLNSLSVNRPGDSLRPRVTRFRFSIIVYSFVYAFPFKIKNIEFNKLEMEDFL